MRTFVAEAREFCDFMVTAQSLDLNTTLRGLLAMLPSLYVAGLNLPDVEPTARALEIPRQAIPIDFGPRDLYWQVFDPYEDGAEPSVGSLTDDVLDIYSDVKTGLLIYERGSEDDRVDAVWHWKFDFQAHWGDHLVDALRALHWASQRT